jgi:DNA-binding NtrC family response regulator
MNDMEPSANHLAEAHLLVVDDDQLVTSSLSSFFNLEMDLDPVIFNDAPKALSYLEENEPDLIISDFLMPDIDGIQLLRRARELHPEVPRILLTGYADKENAIRAINEVKLFQYIEKPWDNERLRQVVAQGVRHSQLRRTVLTALETLDLDEDELSNLQAALSRLAT